MAGAASEEQRTNYWFWNERVWLQKNRTWAEFENTDKVKYAQFYDLLYGLAVACFLLGLRILLERTVFTFIGTKLGLKPIKFHQAPKNDVLEKYFKSQGSTFSKEVAGLAEQLGWTERQVERWLRKRKKQGKPTALKKFTESAWRCSYYHFLFCFGVYVLSDKPWLWDSMHCWYQFPDHSVTNDVWWYYMLELGFYWSLMFSQFFDVRRKDFVQMFVHHIATILLISFSWTCNLFRIGTLVFIIHDIADCPLEMYKITSAVQMKKTSIGLLVVFLFAWTFSRLFLYIYRILYSTMYQSITIHEIYPIYYILNGLLVLLLCLHIMWTYMIIQVVIHAVTKAEAIDVRSDSSQISDDYDDLDGKDD